MYIKDMLIGGKYLDARLLDAKKVAINGFRCDYNLFQDVNQPPLEIAFCSHDNHGKEKICVSDMIKEDYRDYVALHEYLEQEDKKKLDKVYNPLMDKINKLKKKNIVDLDLEKKRNELENKYDQICMNSLMIELNHIPEKIKNDYLIFRLNYFENLISLVVKKKISGYDIGEMLRLGKTLNKLEDMVFYE